LEPVLRMNTTAIGSCSALERVRQAEAFADASVRGVLEHLQEDLLRPNHLFRDYARLLLELEVHFLFPNLDVTERRVLVEWLQLRNGLALQRLAVSDGRDRGDVAARQQRWLELSVEVGRLARSGLVTAAQKELLEVGFLGKAALNCELDDRSHAR
jgi:hypothetical protein